jgi:hypothetical protein
MRKKGSRNKIFKLYSNYSNVIGTEKLKKLKKCQPKIFTQVVCHLLALPSAVFEFISSYIY